MFNHIVMFRFNEPKLEHAQKAQQMLSALEGQVPQLKKIEVGLDTLHQGRSYDLVLVTQFETLADMQAYQTHPRHVEVLEYMAKVRESAVSVDYLS